MTRLDLVAGPNGSGKTSFVVDILHPVFPAAMFVNADEIARTRWPDNPEGNSYRAARIAARTRDRLIELRQPFIAETVFSHPSKLDLVRAARAAGYTTVVHVLLVPEQLTVERVRIRATHGGHDVPEDKIRRRYARLWPLVARAIRLADRAYVWDNSANTGPDTVAQYVDGRPAGTPRWPVWTPIALREPSDGSAR